MDELAGARAKRKEKQDAAFRAKLVALEVEGKLASYLEAALRAVPGGGAAADKFRDRMLSYKAP